MLEVMDSGGLLGTITRDGVGDPPRLWEIVEDYARVHMITTDQSFDELSNGWSNGWATITGSED